MIQTKLGKIESCKMGTGGYDDAAFGLSVTIAMNGTAVQDFIAASWLTPKESAEEHESQAKFVKRMIKLMTEAKVNDVTALTGTPVEVTLDGNVLKSWRVLTEVL